RGTRSRGAGNGGGPARRTNSLASPGGVSGSKLNPPATPSVSSEWRVRAGPGRAVGCPHESRCRACLYPQGHPGHAGRCPPLLRQGPFAEAGPRRPPAANRPVASPCPLAHHHGQLMAALPDQPVQVRGTLFVVRGPDAFALAILLQLDG